MVNSRPPAASASPDLAVNVAAPVHLHGGYANAVALDSYSLTWNVTSTSGQTFSGSGADFAFTPGHAGTYTAVFTVSDNENAGLSSSATTTVTVNDVGPTVGVVPPQTVNAGDLVTLHGRYSDPATFGASHAVTWHASSSNGQTVDGTGLDFTFTPNDTGIYAVTFTVTDDLNVAGATSTTITALNVAPTATFPASLQVSEGASAAVSLSNPFSPSSAVTAKGFHYSFALSKGTLASTYDTAGSAGSASFPFAEEGSYTIYGRILDKNNGSTDYTASVVVTDPSVAPTGVTLTTAEGTALTAQTVARFTDPGGPEAVSDYAATIDWGDGSTSSGAAVSLVLDSDGKTFHVQGSHTYGDEGDRTVAVTLHHDSAADVSVTSTVHVTDPALAATGGFVVNATEGIDSGLQTLATFTDPGGAEALTNYSAGVDWGDGQTGTGNISYRNGQFTVKAAHSFNAEGSSTINVTIRHHDTQAAVVTSSARVADAVLAASVGFGVVEGAAGVPVIVGTFTDPGGPEPLSDYSATIDWGDSSTSNGTLVGHCAGRRRHDLPCLGQSRVRRGRHEDSPCDTQSRRLQPGRRRHGDGYRSIGRGDRRLHGNGDRRRRLRSANGGHFHRPRRGRGTCRLHRQH